VDGVDGVGNGTLAESTCIGDGGRTAGAGTGVGAGADARGVRVREKFEGPGL
jgi:hypothetical protein